MFGQRFLGLIDNSNTVYMTYRVPVPEAPYPQDYIIDQQGYVRYWSDEYDPQEIIRIIDRLLNIGTEEHGSITKPAKLTVYPNPSTEKTGIRLQITDDSNETNKWTIRIFDASGRLVREFGQLPITQLRNYQVVWHGDDDHGHELPSGTYFIKLEADGKVQSEQIIFLKN